MPYTYIQQENDCRFHALALDLFWNDFYWKSCIYIFTSSMKKTRLMLIATWTIKKINYIILSKKYRLVICFLFITYLTKNDLFFQFLEHKQKPIFQLWLEAFYNLNCINWSFTSMISVSCTVFIYHFFYVNISLKNLNS